MDKTDWIKIVAAAFIGALAKEIVSALITRLKNSSLGPKLKRWLSGLIVFNQVTIIVIPKIIENFLGIALGVWVLNMLFNIPRPIQRLDVLLISLSVLYTVNEFKGLIEFFFYYNAGRKLGQGWTNPALAPGRIEAGSLESGTPTEVLKEKIGD